jgi:hypothetical protein
MARAIRGGVKVDFLLADAWFGKMARDPRHLFSMTDFN